MDLTIWIYHSDTGEAKICLDSNGYPEKCKVYSLLEEENPFAIRYEVEDPTTGKEFTVCYEIQKTDKDECKSFEFGENSQDIEVYLSGFDNISDDAETQQPAPKDGVDQSSNKNILTFKDTQRGIDINYPANFEVIEGDSVTTDRVEYIASFLQPFQDMDDQFQEYYAIILDPIPYDRNLEEYLVETIKGYEGTYDNYKTIESSTNVIISGQPGYELIYSYMGEEPNTERKVLETGTIVDDKVYYIEYEAESTQFENNLPQVTALISSLQINPRQ